ncbi:MAG: hypothetical protein ACE5HV_00040 [Acidobacteriota bacterium]
MTPLELRTHEVVALAREASIRDKKREDLNYMIETLATAFARLEQKLSVGYVRRDLPPVPGPTGETGHG